MLLLLLVLMTALVTFLDHRSISEDVTRTDSITMTLYGGIAMDAGVIIAADSLLRDMLEMEEILDRADSIRRGRALDLKGIGDVDTLIRLGDSILLRQKDALSGIMSARRHMPPTASASAVDTLVAGLTAQQLRQSRRLNNVKYDMQGLKRTGDWDGAFDMSADTVVLANRMMNAAYVMMAPQSRLVKDRVLRRRWFLFGPLSVSDDASLSLFATVDTDADRHIVIERSGVRIMTRHPKDSYELLYAGGNKVCRELVIKDPEAFWSSGRVLVISHR